MLVKDITLATPSLVVHSEDSGRLPHTSLGQVLVVVHTPCGSERHPASQTINLASWSSTDGEPHGELNKQTVEGSLDTGMENHSHTIENSRTGP